MLALGLAAGCASDGSSDPSTSINDTCETAQNLVCEELDGCPLGTDGSDCLFHCQDPSNQWDGACTHRAAARDSETVEPERGSGGSGGAVGTWDGRVTVRGATSGSEVERHYRVYVPRRYNPDRPTPVLFALGGFTVDMYWLAEFTELDRAADRDDFIVVYAHPEYRNFSGTWLYAWYVYENAYQGGWSDNPDIAYLEAVLTEVGGLYNVDRTRVFVSGHSRGGGLSVIAGFERPDLFAGFCAQAGFANVNSYAERMAERADVARPAAVLVHGDADPDVDVSASDEMASDLENLGFGDDLWYARLPGATHEWQSQLNPAVIEFLTERPLELEEVGW